MKEVKFWTVNCEIFRSDDELETFIHDLERYVTVMFHKCNMPQNNSEGWLESFVRDYEHWPKRIFRNNQHPLKSYFSIETRLI
ncbi:MAG: hypothetical protein HQM11_16550 [SAR324 cluster bacterium]|nr:hypothetical protein [SAR324 cluster bacterium]